MIQWNASLATGHPQVDQDHQKLIVSLNELEIALKEGAGKEQVSQLIAFLNRYAREHFSREEAHMLRVGCPAHEENKREHAQFVAKLDGWVHRLNEGVSTALVLEIFRETSAWIRVHIVRTDCKLRGCSLI